MNGIILNAILHTCNSTYPEDKAGKDHEFKQTRAELIANKHT